MPGTGAAKKKEDFEQSDSFSCAGTHIIGGVINAALLVLLGVFPLFTHDAYFDILETKYKCYYVTVIGMILLTLILLMVMMFVDLKEYKGMHMKRFLGKLAPDCWKKSFCVTDTAIFVFWCVCVLSTLRSDYLYEAFWGNEGRYSGLFLITLYVISYFLISRFYRSGKYVYQIFVVSSLLVCLLGISDYFQMDLLHFHHEMKREDITKFTSTFGNINTYTAYVAMYMGFTSMMFVTEKNKKILWWYYLNMIVSFFAIIMGQSDNAYLALAALFGLAPFLVFQYREGTQRYLMMLASLATVFEIISIVNRIFAGHVIKFTGIMKVIIGLPFFPVVVIALWFVAISYSVTIGKNNHGNISKMQDKDAWNTANGKIRVVIWTIVCAFVVVGTALLLWMANTGYADLSQFGSVRNYLIFNDSWGTNRGYIWKKSIEIFNEFSAEKKLLGYGPDTFGIITVKQYFAEMSTVTGQVFDSAHNEYLQYLVTVGILGTCSYIFGICSFCIRMCRMWKKNTYVAGILFAVLCYAIQAIVNLNLPVVTPVFWTLLSLGMAEYRRCEQ
jgi:hypothetical protein